MNKLAKTTIVAFVIALIYINYVLISEVVFINNFGSSKVTKDSKKIGTMSLYTSPIPYPAPSRLTGHSWIYIYNTSDKPFFVNNTFVPVNDGVSIGTTANPAMPHLGVWLNVEGYNINYLENVSIEKDFYEEDLEYLETYLKYHDKWNLIYNCAYFASELWNNLSTDTTENIRAITPIGLQFKIMEEDNYQVNKYYTVYEYFKPYDDGEK